MKISIVTVCYNAASTIADAIKSVASQTYSDIEYIVVDGASKDGTQDVIKQHEDGITTFVSEPDKGIYDAYNKGIALATGDVIGFINADDFYANDNVIARVAECFSDPSVEVVYGDLCYVKQDQPDEIVRYWKSSEYKPGKFGRGWVPPHPTFFVRSGIYKCPNGGYDTNYKLAADMEMITRCMVVNQTKNIYLPEVLVKMRLGGATNQSVSNIIDQNREILQAFKKNGVKTTLPRFLIGKFFSRSRQFFIRPQT